MKFVTHLALSMLVLLLACSPGRKGKVIKEKIPEIAGTWYQDGDKQRVCYIVQNDRDLVFMSGNETSNGYFKSSMEVFAKEWNRNAILSQNGKTLSWADRKWVRGTFVYPNVAGAWYENGEAAKQITVVQKKNKLVMDNGQQKLNAYFYTSNALYIIENNNYATYNPLNGTISWGAKQWTRKPKS